MAFSKQWYNLIALHVFKSLKLSLSEHKRTYFLLNRLYKITESLPSYLAHTSNLVVFSGAKGTMKLGHIPTFAFLGE